MEVQAQLVERLAARSHAGGPGNLDLRQIHKQLEQVKALWQERAQTFLTAIEKLVGA